MNQKTPEQSCCHFFETLAANSRTKPLLSALHTKDIQTTLVLFLIWYSTNHYGRVTKRDIGTLIEASETWHSNVVKALSNLASTITFTEMNDSIKEEAHNLNQFALKAEMEMLEKTLQLKSASPRSIEQQLNDCCHNLAKYIDTIKQGVDTTLEYNISLLMHACFPSCIHEILETKLNQAIKKATSHSKASQKELPL